MKVSKREAIKVTGRSAQVKRPSLKNEAGPDAASKMNEQQPHTYFTDVEKKEKKTHFISNCLHLPIARTTMQTPAAGKQPSISNQRVSHKKKKKM